MKVIVIDGKMMKNPKEAHAHIAREAGFPQHYGHNLDALADCLGELGKNTCIVLLNEKDMRRNLGGYANRLIAVFEDVSSEADSFDFAICED